MLGLAFLASKLHVGAQFAIKVKKKKSQKKKFKTEGP